MYVGIPWCHRCDDCMRETEEIKTDKILRQIHERDKEGNKHLLYSRKPVNNMITNMKRFSLKI